MDNKDLIRGQCVKTPSGAWQFTAAIHIGHEELFVVGEYKPTRAEAWKSGWLAVEAAIENHGKEITR